MDVTDIATAYEEVEREARIKMQRRASNPALTSRRQYLAELCTLAAQRGANDPEVQAMDRECLNQCGEQLSLEAENDCVFCSKECAEDWEARDRARKLAGNRH